VSAFATLLLVLVTRITFGFWERALRVKTLTCGLFSEFLDYYLSLSNHSLTDVECRQEADNPKTGVVVGWLRSRGWRCLGRCS